MKIPDTYKVVISEIEGITGHGMMLTGHVNISNNYRDVLFEIKL
ncbi:hypothetical protein [Lacinutrix undariae]